MAPPRRVSLAVAAASIIATAGVLAWHLGCRWSSKEAADDPEIVSLGKSVYRQYCASCHGANLEGQKNWREPLPNGRLPAPPHNAEGHTWHHPDAVLFALTKGNTGGVGAGYETDMPRFGGTLSDDQIRAVLAFIKSTWPPEIRARQERANRGFKPP